MPSQPLIDHRMAAEGLRGLLGDSLVLSAAECLIKQMEECAAELEEAADRLARLLAHDALDDAEGCVADVEAELGRLAGHLSDDEREDGQ